MTVPPVLQGGVSVIKNWFLLYFQGNQKSIFHNKELLAISSPVRTDYGKWNLDPQHIYAEQMFPPYKKKNTKNRLLEPPDSSFPSENTLSCYACSEILDFIPSETVWFSSSQQPSPSASVATCHFVLFHCFFLGRHPTDPRVLSWLHSPLPASF